MNKTCAVCGKNIYKSDLCSQCWKDWCPEGKTPEWVKELIKYDGAERKRLERHEEISFTDDNRDDTGAKMVNLDEI